MRRQSMAWAWCLPLALLGGCLLPSFENVPAVVDAEGGAGSGGSAGQAPTDAGEPAAGGAPAGGNGGDTPGDLVLEPDTYIVQQGKVLKVAAARGVLSNDPALGLVVSDFNHSDRNRPPAYDAELSVEADGSLTFKPAAAFFGHYEARYSVTGPGGETGTGSIMFIVQPSAATLSPLEVGIGGVTLTGGSKDAMGGAIAALGDVNADGFDDFAVGASGAAAGKGAVYVVFGRSDFSALTLGALADSSVEDRYAVLAGSEAAPVSRFFGSAGKFNADKSPDIVVGAPDSDTGRVFVVYGGKGLKGTITLSTMMDSGLALSGEFQDGALGRGVAGGGDFNGDGKSDLLAGGTAMNGNGSLYLVLDNPAESASINQVQNRAQMEDAAAGDLPQSLAFVGDVNGDGKDDLLATSSRNVALLLGQGALADVPADIADIVLDKRGLVHVRENTTGAASVAAAGDLNGDDQADFAYCDRFKTDTRCYAFFGPRDLSGSLERPDWQLTGFVDLPPFLATGADLNQDGFADLVVAEEGKAYVVFGRDSGFGAVDVRSLGSDGFSLSAPDGGTIASVGTLGDINGDGYGDLAVGDPTASGGVGRVYVVFGGPYSAEQR